MGDPTIDPSDAPVFPPLDERIRDADARSAGASSTTPTGLMSNGAERGDAAAGAAAFDRLQSLVADDLARVNGLIGDRMVSEHAPLIPKLAAHLIEAGGKRLRPILTLACARLCGYAGDDHVRLAATVEFIHTATLLHDDVVDESALRRGRASANHLWGNKPSVLVGDFLFSRSFQLMVETGSLRVLDILANAAAVIAEGEVLQLSMAKTLSETDDLYMRVIRAKTAALFQAATEVGGVVAGASEDEIAALATFGDELGIAFQLADDALDYGGAANRMGKSTGDDFREGKATLPVLIAYAAGDADERAFWRRCIERGEQADEDLAFAIELMRRHRALEATVERARSHIDAARAALAQLPQNAYRQALEDVADFVVARAR